MRKKLTILLPLYLAGMILLAFVVFPHHHHNNYICFNTTHSHTTSEGNTENHRNGPFSEKSGCIAHLFQTQLNSNSGRNLQDNPNNIPSHIPFLDCILSEITGMLLYQTDSLSFPATQNENFYAFLLALSRVTRAPPIC